MKILFTSVGRRVELMQAFKNAAEKAHIDLEIYGADITETAPALAFCDHSVIVPRIKDPDYIPALQKVCAEEQIDVWSIGKPGIRDVLNQCTFFAEKACCRSHYRKQKQRNHLDSRSPYLEVTCKLR